MKNLKNLGTVLKKEELKNINGSFGFGGGHDCQAPYCVNQFGRCEYNHNWYTEGCAGQGITTLLD